MNFSNMTLVGRGVHSLRQVKLYLSVKKKRAGWKWHMMWVRPGDPLWRLYQRYGPTATTHDALSTRA